MPRGGGPGRTARCLAPPGVVAPGGPPSVRPAGHRVLTIECVNLQPPAPLLASLAHVPESQLFEVRSFDPLTIGATVCALMAAALLASWLPARRAMRADPAVTLRYE